MSASVAPLTLLMFSHIPDCSPAAHQMLDKWNVESYPEVNGPLNDHEIKERNRNTLEINENLRVRLLLLISFSLMGLVLLSLLP